MRPSWDRGATALVVLVGLIAVACVVATAGHGLVRLDAVIAFGVFITLGELARVRLPGERSAVPIGTAGALGYALLFNVSHDPVDQPLYQVVAVCAFAFLLGALVQATARRPARLPEAARRLLVVAFAGLIMRLVEPHKLRELALPDYRHDLSWIALLLVSIVVLAGILDAALGAVLRTGHTHAPFSASLRDEVRAIGGMTIAIGATGVLIALATPTMRLYALPVFCVPLLLTQFAFRRYASIRGTYLQTIRSLSRVTEVGGYVEDGHARRVSRLAVAVGREFGMSEQELLDLEFAALLHDIGQLSLTDPIPNGATLLVAPVERRRIAELGAEVIRTTKVLDHVAAVVERQADPYRHRRQHADATLPLDSRIIKAVSAYDDLVGSRGGLDDVADALERLRMGMAYEYDPKVVEVLTRVIDRHIERTHQIPT